MQAVAARPDSRLFLLRPLHPNRGMHALEFATCRPRYGLIMYARSFEGEVAIISLFHKEAPTNDFLFVQ